MNEARARGIVAERSGGVCEVCGSARATNMHHRLNRSQGGTWAPSNLLHLCGSGTTGCHGFITCNPAAAGHSGAALQSHQDPATTPVQLITWLGGVRPYLLGDDGTYGTA